MSVSMAYFSIFYDMFLFKCLTVFHVQTLISFIKFNLLFVFAAIVNGIAFLISLSNSLLSVYRHKFLYISFVSCNFTELSLLISLCVCVCVAPLWKSLFVEFLYIIYYLQALTVLFIFCLIAVTRTSSTMLSKSVKNGHLFLVLDLRKVLSEFPCWVWC